MTTRRTRRLGLAAGFFSITKELRVVANNVPFKAVFLKVGHGVAVPDDHVIRGRLSNSPTAPVESFRMAEMLMLTSVLLK